MPIHPRLARPCPGSTLPLALWSLLLLAGLGLNQARQLQQQRPWIEGEQTQHTLFRAAENLLYQVQTQLGQPGLALPALSETDQNHLHLLSGSTLGHWQGHPGPWHDISSDGEPPVGGRYALESLGAVTDTTPCPSGAAPQRYRITVVTAPLGPPAASESGVWLQAEVYRCSSPDEPAVRRVWWQRLL